MESLGCAFVATATEVKIADFIPINLGHFV